MALYVTTTSSSSASIPRGWGRNPTSNGSRTASRGRTRCSTRCSVRSFFDRKDWFPRGTLPWIYSKWPQHLHVTVSVRRSGNRQQLRGIWRRSLHGTALLRRRQLGLPRSLRLLSYPAPSEHPVSFRTNTNSDASMDAATGSRDLFSATKNDPSERNSAVMGGRASRSASEDTPSSHAEEQATSTDGASSFGRLFLRDQGHPRECHTTSEDEALIACVTRMRCTLRHCAQLDSQYASSERTRSERIRSEI
ncbi:hypothetical protein C8T65DRAFT_663901 [Cerioporus squamosus]|nr:hypothetical protein C8T65DRAFT_663901 [Cerioporus squamosus]